MRTTSSRLLAVLDATGNRFLLLDRLSETSGNVPRMGPPLDTERVAEAGCDGLLVLERPRAGGDVRMLLWNRDGSRARFCGNGLRCAGKYVLEHGYLARPELRVETDSGTRRVRCVVEGGRVVHAAAEMGPVRLVRPHGIAGAGPPVRGFQVDVGNPHFVLLVESVEEVHLAGWASALEAHPAFPGGVNVECVERRGAGLSLRVHERGVGETLSCGSGVAAAARVAHEVLRMPLPLRVETRGGVLHVQRDERSAPAGPLWVRGPVVELDPIEHPGD